MFGYKRCIGCGKIKRLYKESMCPCCIERHQPSPAKVVYKSSLDKELYKSSDNDMDIVIPAMMFASILSNEKFHIEPAVQEDKPIFEGGSSGGAGAERSFESPGVQIHETSDDSSPSYDSDGGSSDSDGAGGSSDSSGGWD